MNIEPQWCLVTMVSDSLTQTQRREISPTLLTLTLPTLTPWRRTGKAYRLVRVVFWEDIWFN